MSRTTKPLTLGTMLRKLREDKTSRSGKKLTLQALGKKTEIDYSTLSKYEQDLRLVSTRAYTAILKVLRPTQSQRRDLNRLHDKAKVDPPASSKLRTIASLAVRGNNIRLRDITFIEKVNPQNDKSGKYRLLMKDGTSFDLTVTVRKS